LAAAVAAAARWMAWEGGEGGAWCNRRLVRNGCVWGHGTGEVCKRGETS